MATEEEKDRKELRKTRREKLAGYFYNISQLTFAAMVLGGLTPIFSDKIDSTNWVVILIGMFFTCALAYLANQILKS